MILQGCFMGSGLNIMFQDLKSKFNSNRIINTMTIAASLKFSDILAATFSATRLGLQEKKEKKISRRVYPNTSSQGPFHYTYFESFVRSLA